MRDRKWLLKTILLSNVSNKALQYIFVNESPQNFKIGNNDYEVDETNETMQYIFGNSFPENSTNLNNPDYEMAEPEKSDAGKN